MENGLALSKVLPAISMLLFLAGNEEGMVLEMLDLEDALQVVDIILTIVWQFTIWAFPPTPYTSSGLSRLPFKLATGLSHRPYTHPLGLSRLPIQISNRAFRANPTNTIWALPPTIYAILWLSRLPFISNRAFPPTLPTSFGLSRRPYTHLLGSSPAYRSISNWGLPAYPYQHHLGSLPPTIYASSGLSHLLFNQQPGLPRQPYQHHLGSPADHIRIFWALPPTRSISNRGLPAYPTNTIWALPPTIYAYSGLSHLPFNQQPGLPANPTNTIWALPPTVYTSFGLSCLPLYYYLGLPTDPNYTSWALPADHNDTIWTLPSTSQLLSRCSHSP
ncbi:hypothetical protein DFJ58DRAFT_847204 [Suillus subalutaceus]|uniref:uncharacterized protein n=1 Tax=Suillus subalutaceus TaxID=48586 RepID=UPI001B876617|nr:uncharacterized protein DFJ58DRAFT_847204 [Suillus subalutaceus]KAG1836056.1 hypothetical protein DFJ58DRAFT_847204 [Suillus subalutaceus]